MNKFLNSKYLFSEEFELTSNLSASEIQNKIEDKAEIIDSLPIIWATRSAKDHEGVLMDNGFLIRRLPKVGYSAFLPICNGEITKDGSKESKINLSIKYPIYLRVFMFVAILFTSWLLLQGLISSIENKPVGENQEYESVMKDLDSVSANEVRGLVEGKNSYSNIFGKLLFIVVVYTLALVLFNHESQLLRNNMYTWFGSSPDDT